MFTLIVIIFILDVIATWLVNMEDVDEGTMIGFIGMAIMTTFAIIVVIAYQIANGFVEPKSLSIIGTFILVLQGIRKLRRLG